MVKSKKDKFKSTADGRPPSGEKIPGTFRDISLEPLSPEMIDLYDSECINRGVNRSEFFIMIIRSDQLSHIWDMPIRVGKGWHEAEGILLESGKMAKYDPQLQRLHDIIEELGDPPDGFLQP